VHEERDHHAPPHRHRRHRHEPVAADLRDEAADPRAELDALGIELNRRPEAAAALLVAELILLDIPLEIPERVAERSAGRRTLAATVSEKK
jgi:hypothetical protein